MTSLEWLEYLEKKIADKERELIRLQCVCAEIRKRKGIPDPNRLAATREKHAERLQKENPNMPWSHIMEHIRDDQTMVEYLAEVEAEKTSTMKTDE